MSRFLHLFAMRGFTLLATLGTLHQAVAQRPAMTYPKMVPVEQYLMEDQQAEVALARSAAPESISRDAGVMILTRHGFETAIQSKNGFVCIVGRGWSSAPDADFWNPKVRVPMCLNAASVRSYLLRITRTTLSALAGDNPAQTNTAVIEAVAKKELPPMEPGAICYMMSKQGYGGDAIPHWPSHVMLFYSDMDISTWGANLPGSPILGVNDPSEHLTQFVIPVKQWSDGTSAADNVEHHHL